MNNLYEEYASVQSQIAALELKKEQLRPHIIKMMTDKGENKVETSVGSFTISKLKKWIYPERIKKMEEDLKAEKNKAQSTEEATYEEEPSLRFTMVKL